MSSASGQISAFFRHLNSEDVAYCHWKSNAHLADSFASKTDFDLLVDERHRGHLQDLLRRRGIKRRLSTEDKVYPGMEDYLGFDSGTGNLFHLHVHYRLVFGKQYEKNYRLPIEREILATAIDDATYPIKRIRPELELLVLSLRAILKARRGWKPAVKSMLGRKTIPWNIAREFEYLQNEYDREAFDQYVTEYFPQLTDVFARMTRNDVSRISYATLGRFRKRVVEALEPYQMLPPNQLAVQRRLRCEASNSSRSWLRGGGVTIAVVGADGAGKSSVVAEVSKWLGWKLSVATAYMGIPKQDRRVTSLDLLIRFFRKFRLATVENLFKHIRWVEIAQRRYRTFRKSEDWKQQDYVVICDRFPLADFHDMEQPMDGPRITQPGRWKNRERSFYQRIPEPDYTFVLHVTPEESLRRKPNGKNGSYATTVQQKVAAVNRLQGDTCTRTIHIDTLRGRDETMLEVKRKLWEIL